MPDAVRNLLKYSGLKTAAEKLGIEAIDRRHTMLNVKFHPETHIDPARLMNLVNQSRGEQFSPAGVLMLPLDGATAPGEILEFLKQRSSSYRHRGVAHAYVHECVRYQIYSFAAFLLSYPSSTCTTRTFFSATGESWPIGI